MNTEQLIQEISQYSVPELCDGMDVFRTMEPEIRHMVGGTKIVGTAFTIDVSAGEGGYVAEALQHVMPGDIIVIAGKGNVRSSYWGDHRSFCAKKLGAAGVVIDGAYRDIDGCEAVGVPLFARAVTPGSALKSGRGRMGIAVSCGGVTVHPGDIVVGDRNGVCVFPVEEAKDILKRTAEKVRNQNYTLELMAKTGQVITTVLKAGCTGD